MISDKDKEWIRNFTKDFIARNKVRSVLLKEIKEYHPDFDNFLDHENIKRESEARKSSMDQAIKRMDKTIQDLKDLKNKKRHTVRISVTWFSGGTSLEVLNRIVAMGHAICVSRTRNFFSNEFLFKVSDKGLKLLQGVGNVYDIN